MITAADLGRSLPFRSLDNIKKGEGIILPAWDHDYRFIARAIKEIPHGMVTRDVLANEEVYPNEIIVELGVDHQ